MKILVIGGGGQLGSKILQHAKKSHHLSATYMTRKPPIDQDKTYQLDKTDRNSTHQIIKELTPDVVIDTAALHSVGYCETHKDEARAVNVIGTKNIAEACNEYDAKMMFISTDYVFDGKKGNYREDDPANPINYYGLSKLEAEKAVEQTCKDYIIARPSVIYSWISSTQIRSSSGKPLNFAMWLTQKLEKNEAVNIVTDQYSSPTLADSLAETILKMCEKDITGLYHIAGKTRLNRYEFSLKLAEKMSYDQSLINPIKTSQLKQIAKRPMDSSLNVEKTEKELNIKLPTISEALDIFIKQVKGETT